MNNEDRDTHDDASVAIIGYAIRFPGAKNVEEFWQNLRDGVESISFFDDADLEAEGYPPSVLSHPACVKAGGLLEGIELFDAPFFNYSPREAEIIDPQQRLFLECAWEALENAGYDADAYDGLVGVFGGVGRNAYLLNVCSHPALVASSSTQITIGNCSDYVTTRVSYKLNLKGPSVNIQTACSTSLVAIHMACQSILNAECNMALAGGLSLNIPQKSALIYEEGGINSPDGHCRSYDARANGVVGGNGGGIVVLKRLADALADGDSVHAVIKGSAINNDGSAKVGFTAPSVQGQAEVIAEAFAVAGVEAETISYVEGHGTGTTLGDPIEVSALTQAFRASTDKKEFCALGSVKANFGHLDTGAGVAGLLKTTLALKHQALPPSLHFERPNPEIDFANSPFFVNAKLTKWESGGEPRRAGVSSFGIGGTNAHAILEEAPFVKVEREFRPWHLLVLSAKTAAALETATTNLTEHLERHQDIELADAAYTLQVGRRAFDHRRTLVCRDAADALRALASRDPQCTSTHLHESRERQIVFMFSGQGAQYVNAGRELYETEAVFRKHFDHCAELLEPHLKADLREVLYPAAGATEEAGHRLGQTELTQPALFALEYSLARTWMRWGVLPQAMMGHSIGEYVAACLAGVFSLEEALALVAARGRLMRTLPGGAMLSVPLRPEDVTPLLGDQLSLAAVNAAALCVVSGPAAAIDELQTRLSDRGITSRRLKTSHAFHSAMMEPIMEAFAGLVTKINLRAPAIPYISNVTGDWITAQEATDPHYWVKHLRQTVRFAEGLRRFAGQPQWIFLEVGPGNTLSSFAQRAKAAEHVVLSSLRSPLQTASDAAFMLATLGRLWMEGVRVAWSKFNAAGTHYRIPLPTYPFERQRYWIGRRLVGEAQREQPGAAAYEQAAEVAPLHPRPETAQLFIAPRTDLEQAIASVWQERLGIGQISVHDNFYELGGDSLLATQIVAQLREMFMIELGLDHFFDRQTIAGVAECVEEILIAGVANLSDDEAQRLLQ